MVVRKKGTQGEFHTETARRLPGETLPGSFLKVESTRHPEGDSPRIFLTESVAERDIGESPQENAPGESHAEHLGEVVLEESSRGRRSRSLRINGRATLRRAPFDPHARQPVVNGFKSRCFGLSSERTGR